MTRSLRNRRRILAAVYPDKDIPALPAAVPDEAPAKPKRNPRDVPLKPESSESA